MVRGQRRKEAIYPQVRQEGDEGAFEVEDDREVVRRDVCRADQQQTSRAVRISSAESRIEPELPGVVHVAGIVGLAIRPHQMWSQMECPGFGVGADAPVLHRRNLARCPRVNHALRVPVEERQVERRAHFVAPAIGNERKWAASDHISPGASAYWNGRGGTAL